MKPKPTTGRGKQPGRKTEHLDAVGATGLGGAVPSVSRLQVIHGLQPDAWPGWVRRHRFHLLAGLVFFVVLTEFLPVLRHEFICYDDNGYVTDNPWVKNGLTWANISHAFRTTELAYWHPLTWISHLVDVQLFGLWSRGHHLTSALLHAVNALLVFVVLRKMTGAVGRSWFVAALFGLHPLHVESVAWVAERKDVLSTFFWLLAIGCYVQWLRQGAAYGLRTIRFYLLSLLFFAAGLMSKPMVVTLPCLLLLFDYWPLNRWGKEAGGAGATGIGRLLMEKAPFFVLVLATSISAVRAQSMLGTLQTTTVYPWTTRVSNALVSYCSYLEKCFFPTKLAFFYPYPENQPMGPVFWAALFLTGVTAVAVAWRKTRPYFLVGWFWYLGTLVPVIGLVQVGGQAMADRYSYVPLLGIFVALAWGAAGVTRGWKHQSLALGSAAAAVLALSGALTNRQLSYWQDSPTLFYHALAVTENNWCAHFCLGYYYAGTPSGLDESIAEYREVVKLAPDFAEGHFSLGAMLARQPVTAAEAVVEYQTVLRLDPRYDKAHYAMARALELVPGRQTDMIAEYERAVQINPDDPNARYYLGNALSRVPARLDDAVTQYRAVLHLQPGWVEVHSNLGTLLMQMPGRAPDALAEYQALLRARPDMAEAHNNLANVFSGMPGRSAETIAEYETAICLRPDFYEAQMNLGNFLLKFPGRISEATHHFEAALRIKPDLEPARAMLDRLRPALLDQSGRP